MPYTVNDFDYTLPEQLIAQFPTDQRAQSRLLIVPNDSDDLIHASFPAIVDAVGKDDLLIFNNTRVIPARLFGEKETGGKIECLIERVLDDHQALAHVRASIAPKINTRIVLENTLQATVLERRENGLYVLSFSNPESLMDLLDQYGRLPLPPYIAREVEREDFDRYQTIYAQHPGAVAAPTAGLHFDDAIFAALNNKGVEMGYVTLHVGAGTFQPVRVENIADHQMHSEWMIVSPELCEQIRACKARGGKVVAIGTTVVRALESAAKSGEITPFSGETAIFISPGYVFRVVDQLLTNFHLPKSTLLMLVSAFAGYDRVMQVYKAAVEANYRFFSYGDAMLLSKCE